MLATGSIMHWFGHFPIDWRTGATFVHDWFALGIWVAVLGHIVYATRDPDTLHGMTSGTVPATWVSKHAPLWSIAIKISPKPTSSEAHPVDEAPIH